MVRVSYLPGLAASRVGDRVPVRAVGAVVVAEDGSYALSVPPTAEMRRDAAANGGWVNFDVGVTTREGLAGGAATPRKIAGTGWAPHGPEGGGTTQVAARTPAGNGPELGTGLGATNRVNFHFAEADVAAARAVRSRGAAGASVRLRNDQHYLLRPGASRTYCSFIVTSKPKRFIRIGRIHNARNSDSRWSYGRKAESNVEVGVSYGGPGAWTTRGSWHVGNRQSTSVSYATSAYRHGYVRSAFQFTQGYYKATYGTGGSHCHGSSIPPGTRSSRATRWVGGVDIDTRGSRFESCTVKHRRFSTFYVRGSGLDKDESRTSQISAGVDIGPITLGSQSGYSENVTQSWDVVRGRGVHLCGLKDFVTEAPGVIFAQDR